MTKNKPLNEHIELIVDNNQIPAGAADHLNEFFNNLNIEEYPNFNLTDPQDAARAAKFASEMLETLKSKMEQIKVLEQMLLSGAKEFKE